MELIQTIKWVTPWLFDDWTGWSKVIELLLEPSAGNSVTVVVFRMKQSRLHRIHSDGYWFYPDLIGNNIFLVRKMNLCLSSQQCLQLGVLESSPDM